MEIRTIYVSCTMYFYVLKIKEKHYYYKIDSILLKEDLGFQESVSR